MNCPSTIQTSRPVVLFFLHGSKNPGGVTFFPFKLGFAGLFGGEGGLERDFLCWFDDALFEAGGIELCNPGLHIAEGGVPMILETAHGISYPAKPAFCTYRAISRCKVG